MQQKINVNPIKRHLKIKSSVISQCLLKTLKYLEFNQNQKSDKAPFVIYADLECLMEKINGRECNPTNPSTAKIGKHILSGFSMSTISSFKSMENKYDVYRGKYCMK